MSLAGMECRRICMGTNAAEPNYLLIKRRVRIPARPACRGEAQPFVPPEALGGPEGAANEGVAAVVAMDELQPLGQDRG